LKSSFIRREKEWAICGNRDGSITGDAVKAQLSLKVHRPGTPPKPLDGLFIFRRNKKKGEGTACSPRRLVRKTSVCTLAHHQP